MKDLGVQSLGFLLSFPLPDFEIQGSHKAQDPLIQEYAFSRIRDPSIIKL